MPELPEERVCTICKEAKPLEDFHRESQNKTTGRSPRCKVCNRQRVKRWEEKSRAKLAARSRRIRKEFPEKARALNKRSLELHPEKTHARSVLKAAVRAGRIVKPGHCEDCCGEFKVAQLHGHHENYEKPLEVNWLCERCHLARHGRELHAEVAS